MPRNVGTVDRVIRIIVGLGLTSLAFFGPENLWFLLGLIPVITGMIGYCPPYGLLGLNTRGCCEPKKAA